MILWVFTKLLVVIKSLCCAVNSHSAICQLYFSKTGREKKEKGTGNTFEDITAKNFPNLMKDMSIHIKAV